MLGPVQQEVLGKQRLGPSNRVAAVYFITWPLVHGEVASKEGRDRRRGGSVPGQLPGRAAIFEIRLEVTCDSDFLLLWEIRTNHSAEAVDIKSVGLGMSTLNIHQVPTPDPALKSETDQGYIGYIDVYMACVDPASCSASFINATQNSVKVS